jgi:hypothetical protein
MAAFTKHKPKNFIARNIIKQSQTARKEVEDLKLPELNAEINPSHLRNAGNERSRTLVVGGGAPSPSEISVGKHQSRSPSNEESEAEAQPPPEQKKEGWHQRQIRI